MSDSKWDFGSSTESVSTVNKSDDEGTTWTDSPYRDVDVYDEYDPLDYNAAPPSPPAPATIAALAVSTVPPRKYRYLPPRIGVKNIERLREITTVTEITQKLLGAQAADAEDKLRQLHEQNLPDLFSSLTAVLANEKKPVGSRTLAGMILKFALDANEQNRNDDLRVWLSLDVKVKDQIKICLLHTLSSPLLDVRRTVSQVIGKVAGIELPAWPELISIFSEVHKVSEFVKEAIPETLGYLCEEVSPDNLTPLIDAHLNSMLSALRTRDVKDTTAWTLGSTVETAPVMRKLQQPVEAHKVSSYERKRQIELEGLLCGSLEIITHKLGALEPMKPVIMRLADDILKLFSHVFAQNQLLLSGKSSIFECFGDMVLATGDNFESFLHNAMPDLQHLVQSCVRTRCADDEIVAHTNFMKIGILEAYNAILKGFKTPKSDIQDTFVHLILQSMDDICKDKDIADDVKKSVIWVLTDLASGDNKATFNIQGCPSFQGFLSECLSSNDNEIKDSAKRAWLAIQTARGVL